MGTVAESGAGTARKGETQLRLQEARSVFDRLSLVEHTETSRPATGSQQRPSGTRTSLIHHRHIHEQLHQELLAIMVGDHRRNEIIQEHTHTT